MYPLLELFTEFARKEGISDTTFIVGGAVRDILMNKEIKDVDITVKGDAIRIAELFAEEIGGTFVLLDEDFGIARVVKNSQFIDICRMRGDTIYEDLADRDITINAIAMPLHPFAHPPELFDPYNGRDDLRHRIIRMVSEKNLIDDPLRLLRVYRFSTMLNFAVEINTSIAVKKHANLISKVAVERIVEELRHILKDASSYKTIKKMEEDGLLFHVFPELENVSVESLRHALHSYGYAEHILNNLSLYFAEGAENIANYFKPDYRTICIKLTTLLPFDDAAEKAGMRLKMSNREIESIHAILTNRHKIAMCMESDKTAVIGFLKKIKEDLYPVLIFNISQHCLCQLNDHPVLLYCKELLEIYHNEIIPRMNILPLITGDDLIREFHLKPSPLFKEILDTIESMTLEGKLYSREDAIKETEKILKLRSVM